MAEIKHPRHIQRLLAWIDDHAMKLIFAGSALILFILLALIIGNAITDRIIDDLRKEEIRQTNLIDQNIKSSTWKRLYKKHGYQTIIFEAGKHPYYINDGGEKCRLI